MVDILDVLGLEQVAEDLHRGVSELASAMDAGSAQLANLGYWSERSCFEQIMGDLVVGVSGVAGDLVIRASGISAAEAALIRLATYEDPFDRRPASRVPRRSNAERERRIDDALAEIVELLKTGGWKLFGLSLGDTDVSREEAAKIGMVFLGLSPSDLGSVLQRLDPDLIGKWLEAVRETGLVGQMGSAFDRFAADLGSRDLAVIVTASDGAVQDAVIAAIGGLASNRTQAWTFRYLADAIADDPTNAMAAVGMLGVMDVGLREAVLTAYEERGLLEPLVDSLVTLESTTLNLWFPASPGGFSPPPPTFKVYDAAALIEFLRLTGPIENADLKANVFIASVENLTGSLEQVSRGTAIEWGASTSYSFENGSGKAALGALADLILTDPKAVFDELNFDVDRTGRVTSDYFRELLRAEGSRPRIEGEPLSDDGALITNQLLAALLGDGLDPAHRAEFFRTREMTPDGTADYVNAERLGFTLGAISVGLDDLAAGDDESWDAVGIILGAAGLVDKTPVTSVVSFIESTTTEIADELERRKIAELKEDYDSFQDALYLEVVPRGPDGNFDHGDSADELERKYGWVRDHADR